MQAWDREEGGEPQRVASSAGAPLALSMQVAWRVCVPPPHAAEQGDLGGGG